MSLLVDTKDGVVVNQISDATVEKPQNEQTEKPFTVPEKFQGKTAEEIARAYVELERHTGQLRNEIGDYRSMTDRLLTIEEKRVSDLKGAGGTVQEDEFNIDPTELLTNPKETLKKWYEAQREKDPVFQEVRQRLDRVEGRVNHNDLQSAHADAEQITSSPEFLDWVKEQPFRLRIAQSAVQAQDVQALDYLLTEYKGDKPQGTKTETKRDSEVDRAKKVTTETASSGVPVQRGKTSDEVFSRRKLIQLKLTNPNEYADLSERILAAYAEGRVVD
jgi:hypothetical protein